MTSHTMRHEASCAVCVSAGCLVDYNKAYNGLEEADIRQPNIPPFFNASIELGKY